MQGLLLPQLVDAGVILIHTKAPAIHLSTSNSRINGQLNNRKNQMILNGTSPEHSPVCDYFQFRGFLSPMLSRMNTAFTNNWTSHSPSILYIVTDKCYVLWRSAGQRRDQGRVLLQNRATVRCARESQGNLTSSVRSASKGHPTLELKFSFNTSAKPVSYWSDTRKACQSHGSEAADTADRVL